MYKLSGVRLRSSNMTNADVAPEAAHNEGIEHGRKTGIVLFTCVRA